MRQADKENKYRSGINMSTHKKANNRNAPHIGKSPKPRTKTGAWRRKRHKTHTKQGSLIK